MYSTRLWICAAMYDTGEFVELRQAPSAGTTATAQPLAKKVSSQAIQVRLDPVTARQA